MGEAPSGRLAPVADVELRLHVAVPFVDLQMTEEIDLRRWLEGEKLAIGVEVDAVDPDVSLLESNLRVFPVRADRPEPANTHVPHKEERLVEPGAEWREFTHEPSRIHRKDAEGDVGVGYQNTPDGVEWHELP